MFEWEVLLTDGSVHLVSADEPAVGEHVVKFYVDGTCVATYVMRNLFGWRERSSPGSWPLQ